MKIETLTLRLGNASSFTTNCYILSESESAQQVVVVDPADHFDQICEALGKRQVAAVILTHRHDDHTGAAAELAAYSKAPVFAHQLDVEAIEHPADRYPFFGKEERQPPTVSDILQDHDIFDLAGVRLEVLHTPGHSIGSICLYDAADGLLLSGDTLFRGTTGRTDLPTGSPEDMHRSLQRLAQLPDAVKVYPGHEGTTTIAAERQRALVEY